MATSFGALLILVVVLSAGLFVISQERQKALAAAEDSRYESLSQRLLRILLTPRSIGWSRTAGEALDHMAAIRTDDQYRSLESMALRGFDAHFGKSISPGGSALRFDPEGRRLLISSLIDPGFKGEVGKTRLWDPVTGGMHSTSIRSNGPVAFRSDGTPLQLTFSEKKPGILELWDVALERLIARFELPVTGVSGPETEDHSDQIYYDYALTPDGSRVAASVKDLDGRPWVYVWDVASGRQLLRLSGRAAHLAFSPDGSLLAGSDDPGKVHVWSILDGREVSTPGSGRLTILCLAFGRALSPVPDDDHDHAAPRRRWWLAAGDTGGNVTLWEAETGNLLFRTSGSDLRVIAITFSPDGTLLATAGQNHARLWDPVTGTSLLDLAPFATRIVIGLAFSPDGRRLAAGSMTHESTPTKSADSSQVELIDFENGRGIQTLRGLGKAVAQIKISSDHRLLAALSTDWRLAICDRSTGELKHVLEPPEGITADNSGLAFSADGRRLALISGDRGTMWDVATGRRITTWRLPLGLADLAVFQPSGRLISFRMETFSGERGPFRAAPYEQFPRVCRIRALLEGGRLQEICKITAFNRHVFDLAAPDDFRFVVLDGIKIDNSGPHRSIGAFDTMTGRQLWTRPQDSNGTANSLFLDARGQELWIREGDHEGVRYQLPELESLGRVPWPIGLGRGVWISASDLNSSGQRERHYRVQEAGKAQPLLDLRAAGTSSATGYFAFSNDGRFVAWSNSDGTVDVADIELLRTRLSRNGGAKKSNAR